MLHGAGTRVLYAVPSAWTTRFALICLAWVGDKTMVFPLTVAEPSIMMDRRFALWRGSQSSSPCVNCHNSVGEPLCDGLSRSVSIGVGKVGVGAVVCFGVRLGPGR